MSISDRHVNIKRTITELFVWLVYLIVTKGLIGVRLFFISSSCDCTHDIDHSGTEAENGRKQTMN